MVNNKKSALVGDLHGGNYYSDLKSFIELMLEIKESEGKLNEIIFLGDFIDGLNKYSTQTYKQFPNPIDFMREFTKFLVEFVNELFHPDRVVFVLGNHDADFKGSIIDYELFRSKYTNAHIVPKHISYNNILCIHTLSKGSRGSSQVGWTPDLINRAKSLVFDYNVNGIAVGHFHKCLSIVLNSSKYFIMLPSFLSPEYVSSDHVMYQPTILIINNNEFKIYKKQFNSIDKINEFNRELFEKLMSDRNKLVKEIIDKNNKDCIKVEYGGKYHYVKKDLIKRIIELYKKYGNGKVVSEKLGINACKVYAILKTYGLVKNNKLNNE